MKIAIFGKKQEELQIPIQLGLKANFYFFEYFDISSEKEFDALIIVNEKKENEIIKLIEAKIIDYYQLMFPPKFYLAHPTESRETVRIWEAGFEQRTGIDLRNPFFDCNNIETQTGNLGKEKYLGMGETVEKLFRADLEETTNKKIMGGIFLVDDSYTIGTFAEMMATKLMGKLVFTVITHPVEAYHNHPTLKLLSDKIFKSQKELEKYLIENKSKLFNLLEKSRKKTQQDPTFSLIYNQIYKNKEFLTR